MKFVDWAKVTVKAGRGGNGALSFRREKFIPKGGPDGADGGQGGSVLFEAVGGIVTLADFEYNRRFQAGHAGHGAGAMRTGANGEDLTVFVPCGTLVRDEEGRILADLVEPGQVFVAARGGRGGRGNAHFASSTRRTPRFAEKGDPGEERTLTLELKLIADVGLVGFPNAGKSSILAAISGAKPRIAGYPFTTLSPNLGVLAVDDQQIVVADVPGLIEGAHEDKGLGLQFLRHVERTRVLLHVVDLSEPDVLKRLEVVQAEFRAYGELKDPLHGANLDSRPCVVVGNKTDLPGAEANARILQEEMARRGTPCLLVSALTGEGIPELIREIVKLVRATPRPEGQTTLADAEPDLEPVKTQELPRRRTRGGTPEPVEVIHLSDGRFRVEHANLEKAVGRINFEHEDAMTRFARLLRKMSVEEALSAAGAVEGDRILIGEEEFDFQPDKIL